MNSNGRGRPRTRTWVEDFPRIDLRKWRLLDWLRPGESTALYLEGMPSFAATFARDGRTLFLWYDDTNQNLAAALPVRYSARHFGGQRVFFGCPDCGRSIEALFCRDNRLACRICLKLSYGCQSEATLDRYGRALQKTKARFDPFREKPLKQRWRTYFGNQARWAEKKRRFLRAVETALEKISPAFRKIPRKT
jgi:hypothetical protein